MAFHDDALTLANVTPKVSASSLKRVEALEGQLGRKLPASFRELVILEAWPSVLADNSNHDHPVGIDELGSSIEDEMLVFMHENQAVCRWAVPLSSAPDPPVMIRADDGRGEGWARGADTFSTWFLCQARDHRLMTQCRAAANVQPLSPEWLEQLQASFEQGSTTYRWPGRRNLRFTGPLRGPVDMNLLYRGRGPLALFQLHVIHVGDPRCTEAAHPRHKPIPKRRTPTFP